MAATPTLQDKAFACIQWLCVECSDDRQKVLNTIYRYAHVALGRCGNPHDDWRRELEGFYDALKQKGEI